MKIWHTSLILILLIFMFSSCEKPEGEGGTSTIMGQVLLKKYNYDFTVKVGEYYSPNIEVFIIYGEDSIYSDIFQTGLNGWYRFEYLNQGTYTIYTYSDDSTRLDPSKTIPVSATIIIDENNEIFLADDLVIFDND